MRSVLPSNSPKCPHNGNAFKEPFPIEIIHIGIGIRVMLPLGHLLPTIFDNGLNLSFAPAVRK